MTRQADTTADIAQSRIPPLPLILLGIVAGYLSGLFGVGGGVIVVPILLLLGLDQRIAVGSSVAAILPTAIVGAAGYGLSGSVDWIAGAMLALGIVAGAQFGSYLLNILPRDVLFWLFLSFMIVVVVSLWIVIPERDDEIELTILSSIALVLTGVVTGVLSALLGVGGGIIIVPVLIFFFGASDLIAKGTSLLMMVPGSISATIGNARRQNLNFRIAAYVGISACVASPLGLLTAHAISPFWSNVAFSVLMAGVAIQLLVKRLRTRKKKS